METAGQYGIPFIDGEKFINVSSPEDYAPKGPHLSINGYRKISKPIIDTIYPIQKIEEAHERLRTNSTIGKIVIEIRK